jgi:membrane-associated phospholipid phosphatase
MLRRVLETAAKLGVVWLFFLAWAVVYDRVNQHGADPARTIHFKIRPTDRFPWIIQPWTAVIYLFGGFALPVLPFALHRSWRGLRFVLTCYTLTSLIAFAVYWFFPLGIMRPVYTGDGLGERLMRGVFTWDLEANCFPSSHTFFAVLGALLVSVGGARPAVRRATWALAVAVCATTVTTGQHYFIDIAGGIVAALLGFSVARLLMPAHGAGMDRVS